MGRIRDFRPVYPVFIADGSPKLTFNRVGRDTELCNSMWTSLRLTGRQLEILTGETTFSGLGIRGISSHGRCTNLSPESGRPQDSKLLEQISSLSRK